MPMHAQQIKRTKSKASALISDHGEQATEHQRELMLRDRSMLKLLHDKTSTLAMVCYENTYQMQPTKKSFLSGHDHKD